MSKYRKQFLQLISTIILLKKVRGCLCVLCWKKSGLFEHDLLYHYCCTTESIVTASVCDSAAARQPTGEPYSRWYRKLREPSGWSSPGGYLPHLLPQESEIPYCRSVIINWQSVGQVWLFEPNVTGDPCQKHFELLMSSKHYRAF